MPTAFTAGFEYEEPDWRGNGESLPGIVACCGTIAVQMDCGSEKAS